MTVSMGLFSHSLPPFDRAAFDALSHWYASPLGQHLLKRERALTEDILSTRFGYHLLQLGCADVDFCSSSPIGHKIRLNPFFTDARNESVVAEPEALPLASTSLDCVVLHHALDYAQDHHQLLREAARVLIAGGWIIVIGFNPWSTWGLRNKLMRWQLLLPWRASTLSSNRVCDWLRLLDFQIDRTRYAEYAWPYNAQTIMRFGGWLEKLASYLNWPTGGVYMIAARKQVAPMIPVQRLRRRLPVSPLAMPVTESRNNLD